MMQRLCEGSTNDATATVCNGGAVEGSPFFIGRHGTHTHTISLLRTLNDSFFCCIFRVAIACFDGRGVRNFNRGRGGGWGWVGGGVGLGPQLGIESESGRVGFPQGTTHSRRGSSCRAAHCRPHCRLSPSAGFPPFLFSASPPRPHPTDAPPPRRRPSICVSIRFVGPSPRGRNTKENRPEPTGKRWKLFFDFKRNNSEIIVRQQRRRRPGAMGRRGQYGTISC